MAATSAVLTLVQFECIGITELNSSIWPRKERVAMAQTLRSHLTPEAEIERYGHIAGIVAGCVAILGTLYFVCLYLFAGN